LAALDRRATTPWTQATLELIGRRPETRAATLARELGQEREPFKLNVRKLKNLGLTESLELGYRLSARGESVLTWLREHARA
jgi:Mn-dependent DtxR family transcriptional regulator